MLLAPRLPLLFMGEEYGETNPFPFFSDFSDPKLIEAVREGRKKEFAYFGWTGEVADPFDHSTRDSAVLSWDWNEPNRAGLRQLYRDLLALRRKSSILRDFRHPAARLLGATRVLEVVRQDEANESLTILFNLGPDHRDFPGGSPTLAPSFRSGPAGPGPGKTNPDRLGRGSSPSSARSDKRRLARRTQEFPGETNPGWMLRTRRTQRDRGAARRPHLYHRCFGDFRTVRPRDFRFGRVETDCIPR